VPTSPNLGVNLTPRDAKEFTALTKKAVGKRLLVMLGDRLLTAPLVLAPIETPSFSFSFPTESAMRKAEDDLKRLVQ
jgi:hypothetical protein